MMNNDYTSMILDEQKFPYENMTLDERNFCLKVIRNCKDISNSDHKVNGIGNCEILELEFKKENSYIRANGILTISNENRLIDAEIFIEKEHVVVDMLITRLEVKNEINKYRVLDEFTQEKDSVKRKSYYNYNMKDTYSFLNDNFMKGRLR